MNTQNTVEKYTHRHLDLCTRAHYNTSHYPERGGKLMCQGLDGNLERLKELGATQEQLDKVERLFLAWVNAKSRCISSFITGGSNFPVRRAEKANNAEHNRFKDYSDYIDKVAGALEREKHYEENPDKRPISNDDDDAIDRLKERIAKLEEKQEQMKAVNKLARKGDLAGLVDLVGKAVAEQLMKPDCFGYKGFAPFELTNNNANIKRLKDRLTVLERTKKLDHQVIELPGDVTATLDPDAMRVYFEFPGKPDEATRNLLKSNGFKWTPSQGHWGRKLTGNASHAASAIIRTLKSA